MARMRKTGKLSTVAPSHGLTLTPRSANLPQVVRVQSTGWGDFYWNAFRSAVWLGLCFLLAPYQNTLRR